jgi:hypothetical protein
VTTTATVAGPWTEDAEEDFVLSVRELFDNGAGAGAEPLFEHWQEFPSERAPPWQQQEQDPSAAQQVPRGAERAAALEQQERRTGDLPVQCGHVAADAASTRLDSILAGRWDWFPQAQAVKGMVCAGTSTPASQTRTLAVILLQNRTGRPHRLRILPRRGCRRALLVRTAAQIDREAKLTLPLLPKGVNNEAAEIKRGGRPAELDRNETSDSDKPCNERWSPNPGREKDHHVARHCRPSR